VDVPVFIWMFLILKIPIIAALVLIWYAIQEPAPAEEDSRGGGGGSHHPRLRPPRGPRRGPHAELEPPSPPRVRSTPARGKHLDRS
jgi:hypothetical protein